MPEKPEKTENQVFMKCRANMTRTPCPGVAAELVHNMSGSRTYRCTSCGHTWSVNVGRDAGF